MILLLTPAHNIYLGETKDSAVMSTNLFQYEFLNGKLKFLDTNEYDSITYNTSEHSFSALNRLMTERAIKILRDRGWRMFVEYRQ